MAKAILQGTPRGKLSGSLADQLLRANEAVERNSAYSQASGVPDPIGMLASFLGLPQVARTADRISYGENLTEGKGMTFRPKDDTTIAALSLAPFVGPAAKTAAKSAKYASKELSPIAGELLGSYMDNIGGNSYVVPKDGVKETKKLKKIREMNKVIAGIDRSNLSPSETQMLGIFGQKFAREAKATKKVNKAEASNTGAKSVVSGKREKVDPNKYRLISDLLGPDEVLRLAKNGDHLKRKADGSYVGAPRTVDSPQSLGAIRSSFDDQFQGAASSIEASDPTRVGTWYDRAKEAQSLSNEPYQLARSLENHGVYSAGMSPENELGFTLAHHNSRVLGNQDKAFRGPGMRTLDNAVAEDRPAKLGFKIDEYANKNDPRIANDGLFGVNDFRAAQSWGFTDPTGAPWKAGVSNTMHPFMDAETALAVDRANNAVVGGRSNWQGPHLQEMPWVLGKAEDMYSRGFNARYSAKNNGDDAFEGMKQSIRDANQTMGDFIPKHTMSATWEAIPGKNTGHIPEMITASPEARMAYTNEGRWDVPVDTLDTASGNLVGSGNRDALYSAAGFRQMPNKESFGAYRNSEGVVENNPSRVAPVLADFGIGSQEVNPNTLNAMGAMEKFRALIDGQEYGAANMLKTTNSAKQKNSIQLDSGGVQPTMEQMQNLIEVLEGSGMDLANNSRGASILNFGSSRDADRLMKAKGAEIQSIFPSEMMKGRLNSVYLPGLGPEIGTGQYTADVLQKFADISDALKIGRNFDNPNELANRIGESERVRSIIGDKINRDARFPSARADLQKTRQFFRDADWPRAVEMMRAGATPAAALTALGYSLNGMASEDLE